MTESIAIRQRVRDSLASGDLSICDLSNLECDISVCFRYELRRLINSIELQQIEAYMLDRGFIVENKVHGALAWVRGDTQVLTPTDKGFRDFYSCLRKALDEIAEDDGSDVSQVVDSILKINLDSNTDE